MKIGEVTELGEVSFIDYEKCFIQFCDPGSAGVHGVFSMTFEEIHKYFEKREFVGRLINEMVLRGIPLKKGKK